MTSSEGFLSLSQAALVDLLSRDSFFAPEIDIFRSVIRWMEKHNVSIEDARDLLKVVRLQLVTRNDLFSVIRPSGVYQPDQILDALQWQSEKNPLELQQRGLLSMHNFFFALFGTYHTMWNKSRLIHRLSVLINHQSHKIMNQ